jgi:hypothetical protein
MTHGPFFFHFSVYIKFWFVNIGIVLSEILATQKFLKWW